MNAEQLEELAAGRNPNFIQDMDWEEIITSLARLVIAAEKLVEASEAFLSVMAATKKDQSLMEWCNTSGPLLEALTAYREASK